MPRASSISEELKDATGQIYQRNRYYDSTSGRFTQEDPLGLAGGLNLYGFAGGDPVNFSDPLGLCAGPPDSVQVTVTVQCPNGGTGTRVVWAHRVKNPAAVDSAAQQIKSGGNQDFTPTDVQTDYHRFVLDPNGAVYVLPTTSADGLKIVDPLGHTTFFGLQTIMYFRADVWPSIQGLNMNAVHGGRTTCNIVGHEGVHLGQARGRGGAQPSWPDSVLEQQAYSMNWGC